jgi:hypothetical protein
VFNWFQSRPRVPAKSKRRSSTKLLVESLENRYAPASVCAVWSSGSLAINGDNLNDSIELVQTSPTATEVIGLAGTTVNGGASASGPAISANLNITLGNGADYVYIGPTPGTVGGVGVVGNFQLQLGNGNDIASIFNLTVGKNATIQGGSGTDDIFIAAPTNPATSALYGVGISTGGSLQINVDTGHGGGCSGQPWGFLPSWLFCGGAIKSQIASGADTVTLQNSTIGQSATLQGGNGTDTFLVEATTVGGSLNVTAGNGTDSVTVDSTAVTGSFQTQVGNGGDSIQLSNTTVGQCATIQAGEGADFVYVGPTPGATGSVGIGGNFQLLLGDGNDLASIFNLTVGQNATIQAGNGTDGIFIAAPTNPATGLLYGVGIKTGGNLQIQTEVGNGWGCGQQSWWFPSWFGGWFSKWQPQTGSGTISLQNSTIGQCATLTAGNGNYTFVVEAVTVTTGSLQIQAGNGTDPVTVDTLTTGGSFGLQLGNGGDVIQLSNATIGTSATISAGNGTDYAYVGPTPGASSGGVAVGGSFQLQLGEGSDIASIFNLTVVQNAQIQAGDGTDDIFIAAPTNPTTGLTYGVGISTGGTLSVQVGNGGYCGPRHGWWLPSWFGFCGHNWQSQVATGTDTITLQNSTVGTNATIQGGSSNDTIVVASTVVTGNFSVVTGNGTDPITISGLAVGGGFQVQVGNGSDNIQLSNSAIGQSATIQAGNGTDYVYVGPTPGATGAVVVGGNFNLCLGNGNDNANIFNLGVSGNATIQAGNGNDNIFIAAPTNPATSTLYGVGLYAGGSFQLVVGNGNDAISVENTIVVGSALFQTGTGTDTLFIQLSTSSFGSLILKLGPKTTYTVG